MQPLRRLFLPSWLVGAAAGCGGATEIITPPPPPPTDLILEFEADASDASTAQALGWADGLPDVQVTIRPEDTTKGGEQTFRADARGRATLAGVAPGDYLMEAARWFSPSERARLATGDDALGFVDRRYLAVQGGSTTVALPASRRRGIVVSEWSFNPGDGYDNTGFLELVNNADTTVFLDGMILAEGFNRDYDFPLSGCAENAPYTNDTNGVWTRFFQRFPGSGREYPVPPGAIVVVATDAIDHRRFSAAGLDLSGADFEFSGPSDADNPAVPNLLDVGLKTHVKGHGLTFPGLSVVVALAASSDPGTFATARFADDLYARLPRTSLLEVLSLRSRYDAGVPPCPRLVNAAFDRSESYARGTGGDEQLFSLSRVAAPAAVGAAGLQHTRSSSADFRRTTRSPGVLR